MQSILREGDSTQLGTEAQGELAVRVEICSGGYTNAAGENSNIFDVRVLAGITSKDPSESLTVDEKGNPCINTDRGNVLVSLNEYGYNITGTPKSPMIDIKDTSLGIFAINTVDKLSVQAEIEGLIQDLAHANTTFTMIGRSAIESLATTLAETGSPHSKHVKSLIELAIKYADRQAESPTDEANA